MDVLRSAALLAATVTMGLSAGLFYTYACSIMRGLRICDDRTFVVMMQRFNVTILNGWFAIGFAGALLLTLLAAALHLAVGGAVLASTVGALVLYGAVIVITGTVNVPLNNALDAAGEPADAADAAVTRARFETRWVRWNVARAVLSTAALACLAWALALHGAS